jgi:hypothetical protein
MQAAWRPCNMQVVGVGPPANRIMHEGGKGPAGVLYLTLQDRRRMGGSACTPASFNSMHGERKRTRRRTNRRRNGKRKRLSCIFPTNQHPVDDNYVRECWEDRCMTRMHKMLRGPSKDK